MSKKETIPQEEYDKIERARQNIDSVDDRKVPDDIQRTIENFVDWVDLTAYSRLEGSDRS